MGSVGEAYDNALYFAYDHRTRTHLSLDKDAHDGRPIEPPELARSSRFPKSVACIIATSDARRSATLGRSSPPPAHPARSSLPSGPFSMISENRAPPGKASSRRARTRRPRPVPSVSSLSDEHGRLSSEPTRCWRRTGIGQSRAHASVEGDRGTMTVATSWLLGGPPPSRDARSPSAHRRLSGSHTSGLGGRPGDPVGRGGSVRCRDERGSPPSEAP